MTPGPVAKRASTPAEQIAANVRASALEARGVVRLRIESKLALAAKLRAQAAEATAQRETHGALVSASLEFDRQQFDRLAIEARHAGDVLQARDHEMRSRDARAAQKRIARTRCDTLLLHARQLEADARLLERSLQPRTPR